MRVCRIGVAVYAAYVCAAGESCAAAGMSAAENAFPKYPTKPIRMLVPFPAGGPTDILARIVALKLGEALGQSVVVDNRGGGGGTIAAVAAARSPADGYTLLLGGITTLALAPHMHATLAYDPRRDFAPISQTSLQPVLLMVHPAVRAASVGEFIELAKSRPGQLNYATSGAGGSGHLAGELFKITTGVMVVHVPYKGAAAALNELIAGQVQSMFGTPLAAVPHIKSGKLRALAATGARRTPALPEVPTFAEAGVAGYDASSWNGLVAPAGAPPQLVDRLSAEIANVMRAPNVLDRLAADGAVPVSSTPAEFAAFIRSEDAKWGKVVRHAQIRAD